MKQSDITPEIIALSKRIAEKWRMGVHKGSWWQRTAENYPDELILIPDEGSAELFNDISKHERLHHHGFPIPSISDCLEKLMEFNFNAYDWSSRICKKRKLSLTIFRDNFYECDDGELVNHFLEFEGTTLHEALLEALLTVLEGSHEE